MFSYRLLITLLVCAAGLSGIGFFGAQWYEVMAAKARLNREQDMNSGYTEGLLKVGVTDHTTPDSEFYDLCDKSIRWRTDIVAELRGSHPELDSALKRDVITYLENDNAFTRAKRSLYEDEMNFLKLYDSLLQDLAEQARLDAAAKDLRTMRRLVSVDGAIVSALPAVSAQADVKDRDAVS